MRETPGGRGRARRREHLAWTRLLPRAIARRRRRPLTMISIVRRCWSQAPGIMLTPAVIWRQRVYAEQRGLKGLGEFSSRSARPFQDSRHGPRRPGKAAGTRGGISERQTRRARECPSLQPLARLTLAENPPLVAVCVNRIGTIPCMSSMPAIVTGARRTRLNPSIGPKRSLMDRWSCSIKLLRCLMIAPRFARLDGVRSRIPWPPGAKPDSRRA